MAYSWRDAQRKEEAFYNKIFKAHEIDVDSYNVVLPERCIAFSRKTLERFGYTLGTLKGRVLADIGCGPHGIIRGVALGGRESQSLPQRMYGIDPLMDVYKEYGVLHEDEVTRLMTARGEDIPLSDGSCDYVFCTNAIDHVEKPEAVIREAKRICREGGAFCMSLHIVRTLWAWSRPLLFLVDKNHPHHFREETILDLARKHFARVTVCRHVRVVEDHPEFTFAGIWKTRHTLRAMKRWVSNGMLTSIYIRCEK